MMQMNDTPLYRTQWSVPQARYKAPSKKVVSVPVRFVGSDSERTRGRTDSAIKIQKVARGFLVRKSMRRIAAIRVEVEKIETTVSAPEMVELMRREQRERVRVSETIMNLLLKLDSVRVLHYPGLRDCRKSLIKKAIALQEMVDQIVDAPGQDQPPTTQAEDMKMEALGNEEEKEGKCEGEDCVGTSLAEGVEEKSLVKGEEGDQVGCEEHEEGEKKGGLRNEKEEEDGEGGCVRESVGTSLVEEELGENCLVKEEEGGVGCEEEEDCKSGRGEEGDRNRELLEKMMEDNEKMMGMMAQLFQRNETQTRLLDPLSQTGWSSSREHSLVTR